MRDYGEEYCMKFEIRIKRIAASIFTILSFVFFNDIVQ